MSEKPPAFLRIFGHRGDPGLRYGLDATGRIWHFGAGYEAEARLLLAGPEKRRLRRGYADSMGWVLIEDRTLAEDEEEDEDEEEYLLLLRSPDGQKVIAVAADGSIYDTHPLRGRIRLIRTANLATYSRVMQDAGWEVIYEQKEETAA